MHFVTETAIAFIVSSKLITTFQFYTIVTLLSLSSTSRRTFANRCALNMSQKRNAILSPNLKVSWVPPNPNLIQNLTTKSNKAPERIKVKDEARLRVPKAESIQTSNSSDNLNATDFLQCMINEEETVDSDIMKKWYNLLYKFSTELQEQIESYVSEIPFPIESSIKNRLRATEEGLHRILATIGNLCTSIAKIMDDHLNQVCEAFNDQMIINRHDRRLQHVYKKYEDKFTSTENILKKDVNHFIRMNTDTISNISEWEINNLSTMSDQSSSKFHKKLQLKIKQHNRYLEYFCTFLNFMRFGKLSDARISKKMMMKPKEVTDIANDSDDLDIGKLIENFVKEVKQTINIIMSEYNETIAINGTTDRQEMPTTSRVESQNSESVSMERRLKIQKILRNLSYISMEIENKSDLKNDEYKILNDNLNNIYCFEFRSVFTSEDMELLMRYKEVRGLLDEKELESIKLSPVIKKRRHSEEILSDDCFEPDVRRCSISSMKTEPTSSTSFDNKIVYLDD